MPMAKPAAPTLAAAGLAHWLAVPVARRRQLRRQRSQVP